MLHTWPVILLKTVDSTNNYANVLLNENQHFSECVISALEQTHGRGQKNNQWKTEEGQNLTFSLLLKTDFLPAEKQFYLTQSIALSIIDFLKNLGIEGLIKWPNDILVENRKIAGILIENSVLGDSLFSSIVGIGLNVNQTSFGEMELSPVSLKLINQHIYNCTGLLQQLLDCIYARLQLLKKGQYDNIKKDYLQHLYRYQQPASYKANNESFEGQIVGVSEYGELLVEKNGRTKAYMIQEIKHIIG